MEDAYLIIDYIFQVATKLYDLCSKYWFLSLSIICILVGAIVDNYIESRNE